MLKNLFFLLLLAMHCAFAAPQEAIVITPVAELIGQPYAHSPKKGISIDEYYHQIPFSGSGSSCWRMHQVLFNERVEVLEERGLEAKVRISNFYYIRDNESILHDTYWTAKKNLLYLDKKKKTRLDFSKFPPAIDYQSNVVKCHKEQNVVTLKKPYYDKVTEKTYSVGTRFLAHPDQDFSSSFDRGNFSVYIFDNKKNQLVSTQIPKLYCIRNYSKGADERVKNFVKVLRSWTYTKNGVIPYVLGGFSWTQTCPQNDYITNKDPKSGHCDINRTGWKHGPKQGFDCVGIIGRAAQICEIPFFYKNTLTLMRKMDPLRKGEKLREGDLVWYPGHVMVISNLKKSLLVEARGYDNGHGKVHEVHVGQVFKGVNSLDQLVEMHQSKKPLVVLDVHGNVYKKFKSIKILKIHSVFAE